MKYASTLLLLLGALLTLTGCSHNLIEQRSASSISIPALGAGAGRGDHVFLSDAAYREREAALTGMSGAARNEAEIALSHDAIDTAGELLSRKQIGPATGWYLAGIHHAANVLDRTSSAKKSDSFEQATGLYNYALARTVAPIQLLGIPSQGDTVQVVGPSRTYQLHLTNGDKWLGDRKATTIVAADQLMTPSLDRAVRAGVGAPVVLKSPPLSEEAAKENFVTRKGMWYGRTLIAEFDHKSNAASRVELRLLDPLKHKTISVDGQQEIMAADFVISMVAAIDGSKISNLGILGVFEAAKYMDRSGIYISQEFDPHKIPVVLVHGLQSTPAAWLTMMNDLAKDPVIRDKYQFWFFAYPTGLPVMYSSKILRDEMDRANRKFGLNGKFNHRVIYIGHSMGGMLSQEQVINTGDKLEKAVLKGGTVDALNLSPEDSKLLKDTLIFSQRPFVGRVVFISTPHRGANLATAWFAKLAAKLITLPLQVVKVAVVAATPTSGDKQQEKHEKNVVAAAIPNGISNLAPNLPYLVAINKMKVEVPFHSVIGYLGDKGGPGSTDGVVPYWSSHLAGDKSELWVHSGHSAEDRPETWAEVKRILMLHLGK